MRVVIILISYFVFCVAKPATSNRLKNERQYYLIPDENRNLHLVDIQAIPKFAQPIDHRNVTFLLYTQNNPSTPIEFHPNELGKVIESGVFDPTLPSLFNTHGWGGTGSSAHLVAVRDSILEKYPFNIINIDWSGPAGTFYTEAIQYVNDVGDMIGEFINELVEYYDMDHSQIGLMGHSLGGQLIGRIGYACNGRLSYIVGLDPAYPAFRTDDLSQRLDDSDAKFVQVIHVNSGFLGYPDSIGHADFYLNGGVKQPDCGPDIIGTCSHFLIKDMVAESYSGTYLGWKCDSYQDFLAGICDDNEKSYWAGWPVDTSARGDYHLITRGSPPFIIQ